MASILSRVHIVAIPQMKDTRNKKLETYLEITWSKRPQHRRKIQKSPLDTIWNNNTQYKQNHIIFQEKKLWVKALLTLRRCN